MNVGGVAHRFGGFLGNIRAWKVLERYNNLGVRFAQDRADLFGFKKRVDRVHNPGDRSAECCEYRFIAIGQHQSDNIGFPDAKGPEQVRGLTDFGL